MLVSTANIKAIVTVQVILFAEGQTVADQSLGTGELIHLSFVDLMDVKIKTAGKRDESISDIPASVVVISRAEVATYGYTTLTEMLQSVPSLYYIDDYGEGGPNFGVRGSWSGIPNDNMIILVNGVPQTNDAFPNFPISDLAIPVESIDRVEVIRGPMSVMYGNGAFYGAVNIITNEAESEGVHQLVSAMFGAHRTRNLLVRTSGRSDDFKYTLNLSAHNSYGLDVRLSSMMSDTSSLAGYGLSGSSATGGLMENENKRFEFSGSFRELYFNLVQVEANSEPYFNPPSFSPGNEQRVSYSNLAVGYRRRPSDRVALDARLTYYRTRSEWQYDFLFDGFYANQQIWADAYDLKLDLHADPSAELSMTGGVSYRSIVDAGNMFDLPSFGNPALKSNRIVLSGEDNIVTQAAYFQATYRASSMMSFVAGARLEQSPSYMLDAKFGQGTSASEWIVAEFRRDEVEFMPRLSVILKPTPKHVLKMMYGRAINRPSFFQDYLAIRDISRPALQPEGIQTFELNYLTELSKGLSASVSLYRNTLDSLITRVIEFDSLNAYDSWSENAGEMITNGVEVNLSIAPVHRLGGDLSVSYQTTKDQRSMYEDVEVAYSPSLLAYFKAVYDVRESVTLAITGNFVDGMEPYWDETKTDVNDEVILNARGPSGGRIGLAADGYFTLGTNLRIERIFGSKWYVNIKGVNLLDEVIRYPVFTNTSWADRGTIGSGVSMFLTVRITNYWGSDLIV